MELSRTPTFFLQNIIRLAVETEADMYGENQAHSYDLALGTVFEHPKYKNRVYTTEIDSVSYSFTYKQLQETIHACYFAFAINKAKNGQGKVNIIVSDAPDIFLVHGKDRLGIEICEFFDYWVENVGHPYVDESKEIEKLWAMKGLKNYGWRTDLLVQIRKGCAFNLGKYATELIKYPWSFRKIILGLYGAPENKFTYIVLNTKDMTSYEILDICLDTDKWFLY